MLFIQASIILQLSSFKVDHVIGRSKVQSPTWVKVFLLVEIDVDLFKSEWTFKLIYNLVDLVILEWYLALIVVSIFFLQNPFFFLKK